MGFKSFFILGAQFFLHLLRKLAFWRRPRGAAQFLENYADDGIAPTTAAEGAALVGWLRCTNCGLCEAVCPLDLEPMQPGRFSYAHLAHTAWRDLTAHQIVAAGAKALVDCEPCGACEGICPEHIPLLELAKSVARAEG